MPTPPTSAERELARRNPGFERALLLIGIGLRNEGVREWNFTLRGLGDRELLAAAQLACEREVWDRCINTSDRTRVEVDMAQRFPMPYRKDVVAQAREIGIDPAYIYGLIRQESRFIMDARSHVGASGLMQIMPTTARWTAKKIGLDYKPAMITDREVNLKLGTAYLKLVLDDFQGSQAHGGRGLQRRARPAAPLARGRDGGTGGLGREHPLRRDPRLRQEGAVECGVLQRADGQQAGLAEGAARAADRPARHRRAGLDRDLP